MTTVTGQESEHARTTTAKKPPGERVVEYQRAPACQTAKGTAMDHQFGTPLNGECGGTVDDPPPCEDGPALEPMWVRTRESTDAEWSAWKMTTSYVCPEDLFALSATEFRKLRWAAPALTVQPDRGWVLVNKETIVYTDDATQHLTTEILGQEIDVEASPQSWTWAWGDKTRSTTTTTPGAPYPDQTVWHAYKHLGTATITLTAAWTGRWRLAGHTVWHDVDGTAQTTATSDPFEIRELRTSLIDPNDG
ncbi:MAG TPA: hypothetical protein VNR62_02580 [Cellulomonas sp.]|nr:hypothetical protein [Cellulomonas sp.]